MSDLNSFFAKKDRKKKKTKSLSSSTPKPTTSVSNIESNKTEDDAQAVPLATQPTTITTSQQQDGWIELDDPKTAQVNTGGRVVKQFRRDLDDVGTNNSAANNNNTATTNTNGSSTPSGGVDGPEETTEKFAGWSLRDEAEAKVEVEQVEEVKPAEPEKPAPYRPSVFRQAKKPAGPDVKSVSQFPSLADAVKSNAPEVPQSLKAAQVAAKKAAAAGLSPPTTATSNPNRPRFVNSKTGTAGGRPRFINSKTAQ